jgi:16S rRNA (adenine1518-N6/adenine1519-N6)-dimethyltransferase
LVGQTNYLVVANIPYYITSSIIRHLLAGKIKPQRMVLTVQKEVAGRICANAGDYSLLALSVQVFGSVQVVMDIPASAFYPQPNVDSSVLRVDLYPEPLIPDNKLDCFFQLAQSEKENPAQYPGCRAAMERRPGGCPPAIRGDRSPAAGTDT